MRFGDIAPRKGKWISWTSHGSVLENLNEVAYGHGHSSVISSGRVARGTGHRRWRLVRLKAFFDETQLVTDTVQASSDGLSLSPLSGFALTVGGEVNKLAVNIPIHPA